MLETNVNGMVVVNMLRHRLEEKIENEMRRAGETGRKKLDAEAINQLFWKLSGYLAVAMSIDILTEAEYQMSCNLLMEAMEGNALRAPRFAKIEEHYLKDAGFNEASIIFKINIQERLNENFDRCQHPTVLVEYTSEDALKANELIIEFGKEFGLIKADEFAKAKAMIQAYRNGNMEPKAIFFIPQEFYTKR